MRFGSLFSGIGGLDLGLEWSGMSCAWQVEVEPYCTRVLEKHWPEVKRYGNVKEIDWTQVEPVDLICGGFPCQPFSVAGRRRGAADERNLWPEMLRAVRGIGPRWVLGENVPGIGPYLNTICSDLEREGYEVLPLEIPAAAFGAPHLRYRLFFVAHCPRAREIPKQKLPGEGIRTFNGRKVVADPYEERLSFAGTDRGRKAQSVPRSLGNWRQWWDVEPDVGRVAHGVPHRVDRLRALGNAVVPQVAQWIGERIVNGQAP